MATGQAPRAQPQATHCAKALHGLHRIGRTTRIETAALPQQRADQQFVAAKQPEDERFKQLRGHAYEDNVAACRRLGYNTRPLRLQER